MRISDWSSDVCSSDLDEHARAEPFEGRETLVETISRRPRRIADVAPTAEMPFADMRGLVAILLEQTGDRRQLRIEPVGLADFGVARAAGGDADEADVGRETPGQERSEEHTSELKSLMRKSYAVCR